MSRWFFRLFEVNHSIASSPYPSISFFVMNDIPWHSHWVVDESTPGTAGLNLGLDAKAPWHQWSNELRHIEHEVSTWFTSYRSYFDLNCGKWNIIQQVDASRKYTVLICFVLIWFPSGFPVCLLAMYSTWVTSFCKFARIDFMAGWVG